MKKVYTYPYHLFDARDAIHTLHPTIQSEHTDGVYTFELSLQFGQETLLAKVTLSDEQLEREYDSLMFDITPTMLKVPYLQDLKSVRAGLEQMFSELDLRSTYKRSNVRLIASGKQVSTLYTYLTNEHGKLRIEALVFAQDGTNPMPLHNNFTLAIGNLAYSAVFKTAHKTLHRTSHAMRVFTQSGYLQDLVGMPSSITNPRTAEKQADAIIEFLDNYSRFNIEPDISPFVELHVPRVKMLDLEL